MSNALESISQALNQSLNSIGIFFQTLGWNPFAWNGATWFSLVLLGLTINFAYQWSQRHKKPSKHPELLVSKGIIQQPEERPTQVLTLKVSNLNDFPVQLLEISLQSELMSSPFMVEAAEILAPHAAVELEAVLPNNIVGDSGVLNIYVYTSKRKQKMYRLKSRFDWEPWATRYKVEPTGQKMRIVRHLASTRLNQERKKDWYQQNHKTQPLRIEHDKPIEEKLEPIPRRFATSLDADFPSEF